MRGQRILLRICISRGKCAATMRNVCETSHKDKTEASVRLILRGTFILHKAVVLYLYTLSKRKSVLGQTRKSSTYNGLYVGRSSGLLGLLKCFRIWRWLSNSGVRRRFENLDIIVWNLPCSYNRLWPGQIDQ